MNFDEKVKENGSKLSSGAQLALVLCASSYRFGANWGLLRASDSELRTKLDSLAQERRHIKMLPVCNGGIVLCEENFLRSNVTTLVPEAKSFDFLEGERNRLQEEKQLFTKFTSKLTKALKDGNKSVLKFVNGQAEVILAIYSMNDVNVIKLNGIEYPAFKLTLQDTLKRLGQSPLAGVISVKCSINGKIGFVPLIKVVKEVRERPNFMISILKAMEIANSNTGVFLTLKVRK